MEEAMIEPLSDRVVLSPIKEEKTDGGLYIPPTSQGKELRKAKVIAMGPGRPNWQTGEPMPVSLKIGDIVFFNPMLGQSLRITRNQEYMIQREEDIIGKLTTTK